MMKMDENDEQNPQYHSMQIHRLRILKIIDNMLDKIEIVWCLEELMNTEPELLKDLVNEEQLRVYLDEVGKQSIKKSRRSDRRSTSTVESREKIMDNTRFNTLISTLHQTPAIMQIVTSLLFETSSSPPDFLVKMFNVREFIKNMIRETANEEKDFCKLISNSWRNNKKYKEKNKQMKNNFELKKEELNDKIEEKNVLKESYLENITALNEKCKYDIQAIIWRTETHMKKVYIASEDTQFQLAQEARQITHEYQMILENHLSDEKKLRKKKSKIETVLASWIAKYDNDVNDLQIQLEQQNEGYDGEKAKYDALDAKFMEQTKQYDVLMEEKKEEEQRIWNIKYYAFLKQRCARVIQRWWRRIYSKKFKKRKGKGKKGKKK